MQISYALPMGWDEERNEMYEGSVLFNAFEMKCGQYFKQYSRQVTQLDFLKILVYGIAFVSPEPLGQSNSKGMQQFSLPLDL